MKDPYDHQPISNIELSIAVPWTRGKENLIAGVFDTQHRLQSKVNGMQQLPSSAGRPNLAYRCPPMRAVGKEGDNEVNHFLRLEF